ncbi:S41 family peptidase [Aureibaculum marinum]|uniref:S41 family peptidase n=1 Tax=Aureibaculum marinum TaxID=2487930 RepID=A0A3N4NJY7_9FLAO|nr:S41 family peptidase [Aureibaculum marinum]RPD96634.1 S41 family peptidase [Aureibaculum marinum]
MKKRKIYYPLFLALAVAFGIFIGSMLDYPQKNAALLFSNNSQEAKIKRLINYIQYDYVDKVDTDSLLDGTIRNILSKLDPHSVYIPASEHDALAESMNGEFVGVGIRFFMHNDTLTVTSVVKDGPSAKAGVEAGDRILIADNDTLYGKNLDSNFIIKKLKGEPNTKVKIRVYRKYKDTLLNFTLKRGTIPLVSVPSYYMLTDTLGYIKIDKFANTTYNEFKTAMNSLLKKNMKRLVLDLRGNPGGYLNIATEIIDEFLEDDKLIVFTKNKGGKIEKTFATSKGDFENNQIYVLIDETSASASEIVAGALQDNDKGVIVGRRSFGKGLVQQEMELGDGSAVRLTVSRYYTPTGRSIQKPYNTKDGKSYYNDRLERYRNGELTHGDSIKVVDSLKYITPKGKSVYGGGGIVPDIFVSIDTMAYFGRFHFGPIQDFVFEYLDNHRETMNHWNVNDFIENFDNDEKILNEYLSLFDDQSKIAVESIPYIKLYIKSLIARDLFDENVFYQILNEDDQMLQKVKQLESQVDYLEP